MPLTSYGVLVGRVLESRTEGGTDTPHFQIRVQGCGTDFRVAVNVLSQQSPSELLYVADEAFQHPQVQTLSDLPDGFIAVPSRPGGIALDYIRGNLFDRRAMRALPATAPGPDNDLADKLEHYVSRAAADPAARLYAFGERWGPEAGQPDKVFGFSPGNGVHDIHMNQGNTGRFRDDDGVWQDGGLLLHYPGPDQWVAIFLAFQSQSWHTDDQTGHTIPGPAEPDHLVRIIAALVNPVGPAPERETVTLLNTGAHDLDLDGWTLLDRLKQRMPLDPITLLAGETVRIQLQPPMQLGNQGGLLSLLNPAGLKVDGVAYTRQQAEAEGWTVVF
ncbi:MAG: DUF2278 family protein [Actinomycetota bacterium]|jgi:uncharacterized protein YukJ|nr:DUF2278 family protein [Actinomycetota bacterium]